MSRAIALALLVVTLVPAVCSAVDADDLEVARAVARREGPPAEWHPVLSVDIDCDGVVDRVFSGREDGRYHLVAVLGPISSASRASIVSFRLSGVSQDSFCGPPTLLERELLDYDPLEAIGVVPVGFRRSMRCYGLRLFAGECDSFHLFWNHSDDVLAWWRA